MFVFDVPEQGAFRLMQFARGGCSGSILAQAVTERRKASTVNMPQCCQWLSFKYRSAFRRSFRISFGVSLSHHSGFLSWDGSLALGIPSSLSCDVPELSRQRCSSLEPQESSSLKCTALTGVHGFTLPTE